MHIKIGDKVLITEELLKTYWVDSAPEYKNCIGKVGIVCSLHDMDIVSIFIPDLIPTNPNWGIEGDLSEVSWPMYVSHVKLIE